MIVCNDLMYSNRDQELTNEYISHQLGKKVLHNKCNFFIHHGTSSFELPISSDATIADLHNSVSAVVIHRWHRGLICCQDTDLYVWSRVTKVN